MEIQSNSGSYFVEFKDDFLGIFEEYNFENTHFIIDRQVVENYSAIFQNVLSASSVLLIDANENEFLIGKPLKNPPIKLKLLDKSLHTKLLLLPDLYFGEAYTNGEIVIENGTLTDFLDLALMNFGRGELNFFSYLINRLRGSYRYLTNFNFIKKSKMNVSHHYDIKDDLYDLFLDPKRQYSCAYFKNENDSLETAQNNKIQHIIKKLNIKPNQKVLDIGCGWGSLAIDIAKSAQCEVTGITSSGAGYETVTFPNGGVDVVAGTNYWFCLPSTGIDGLEWGISYDSNGDTGASVTISNSGFRTDRGFGHQLF